MELIYKIEMLSDWHCGTGLTAGADVDLICIKDDYGLPIIPGKTLKGLLKEAAKYYKKYDNENNWNDFLKKSFGEQTNNESEQSDKGEYFFSNATLSQKIIDEIKKDKNKKETLYRQISSTSIDNNGIAKEHSLRKIEVAIPLTLFAKIDNIKEDDVEKLEKCFKLVKRLGTNRNRGLGRCKFSLKEVI